MRNCLLILLLTLCTGLYALSNYTPKEGSKDIIFEDSNLSVLLVLGNLQRDARSGDFFDAKFVLKNKSNDEELSLYSGAVGARQFRDSGWFPLVSTKQFTKDSYISDFVLTRSSENEFCLIIDLNRFDRKQILLVLKEANGNFSKVLECVYRQETADPIIELLSLSYNDGNTFEYISARYSIWDTDAYSPLIRKKGDVEFKPLKPPYVKVIDSNVQVLERQAIGSKSLGKLMINEPVRLLQSGIVDLGLDRDESKIARWYWIEDRNGRVGFIFSRIQTSDGINHY